MALQTPHHALLLAFMMVFAASCKPAPRLKDDDPADLAPTPGAGGTDGGRAELDPAPTLDAPPPVPRSPPAPPVAHHTGRDLEDIPPPQAKSAMPTSWADGVELLVHGRHDCSAVLKREWVRMTCPSAASVALLAGSVDGVMIDVHEPPPDPHAAESFGQPPRDVKGVAVFPVRRGDRRLFQFNVFHQGFGGGYQSAPDSVTAGPVLSEVWLDGEKGPRLEAD